MHLRIGLFILIVALVCSCKSVNRPLTRTETAQSEELQNGAQSIDSVAKEKALLSDSLALLKDSLLNNTTSIDSLASLDSQNASSDTLLTATDSVMRIKSSLEVQIDYSSTDSIVLFQTSKAVLYGEAKVKYGSIDFSAAEMTFNMDSSIVHAYYDVDTAGMEFGYPLFSEKDQQYEGKRMDYNLKTKKGFISGAITKQGEGFITADRTKKNKENELFMQGAKYTTCDQHDHPHFYFQLTKGKVRPRKSMVTGPVYLVIEDVPLPVGLPFAFFPFSEKYSSGVLFPTFGEENQRGFFARNGGYYFAISDYVDLALTGEIYSLGSWGLNARSNYKRRYKYSGSFDASYLITKSGDKMIPGDYMKSKDISVRWTHSQDAKANPYRTVSASVNFSTSSYDRNQIQSIYNPALSTQNNKSSSVNYTRRFPNSPFSLSGSMSINQNSRDSIIDLTLPDLTVTMSKIYPLKRKKRVGKERWYEKISMSYTGYFRNSIREKENKILSANLVKDWRNGMKHSIPISATFSFLDNFNITPSFNYTERWYTNKKERAFDYKSQKVLPKDTIWGFNRVYDYSASVSLSTTLYGFFKPLPFVPFFGKRVEMIRHRLEPSISFNYSPDFGDPRYGYWKEIHYMDQDARQKTYTYSPYENQLFGVPGRGKNGSISFSVLNNLEMKLRSRTDSTEVYKRSLIDNLSAGINYNMAVDSFRWSDINARLVLKVTEGFTLNLSGVFDPYTYDYREDASGKVTPYRVDKMRWQKGFSLGRLRRTGTSFSYSINQDTFKKLFSKEGKKDKGKKRNQDAFEGDSGIDAPPGDTEDEEAGGFGSDLSGSRLLSGQHRESQEVDPYGYLVSPVGWNLSFQYSMGLDYDLSRFDPKRKEYKYKLTHNFSFSGNLQPTKNWQMSFTASYDFDQSKLAYLNCNLSRTMHCWTMTASFNPVGPYKSYMFSIAVNSSLLKDLKYNQSNPPYRGSQNLWY